MNKSHLTSTLNLYRSIGIQVHHDIAYATFKQLSLEFEQHQAIQTNFFKRSGNSSHTERYLPQKPSVEKFRYTTR